MGRILHDDKLIRLCEVDDLSIKIARGDGARWAVGIVEHEQLGSATNVGRDGDQVGVKAVLFAQRQPVDFPSIVLRVRAGDRIAGYRHEGYIARVDEDGRKHGQGRLGADRVIDFCNGVEGNAENPRHELGGGVLERLDTVVRVAPVFELIDPALSVSRTSGSAMSSFSPIPKSRSRRSGWACSAARLARLIFSNL